MIRLMPRRDDMQRALSLLGPLEGRLMAQIWSRRVSEPFVVRDVLALTPDLAYTTVMTTLNRLADKGVLKVSKGASWQVTGMPRLPPSRIASIGYLRRLAKRSRSCAQNDDPQAGNARRGRGGPGYLPECGRWLPDPRPMRSRPRGR